MLGSILGSPNFGKLPIVECESRFENLWLSFTKDFSIDTGNSSA